MFDWNRYHHLENLEPDVIRNVQEELFAKHLSFVSQNSPFYRRLFREKNITAGKVKLHHLNELPLTEKSDLEKHNHDFVAVPRSEIGDIVLTSGTMGHPTRILYSGNDLDRLAFNEKIAFARIGVTENDVVLLTCTMDRCFVAGLAYYSGIRALGAAAVRNGLNTVESHMEIIQMMSPTVIVGVPSFLHKLGLYLNGQGVDTRTASVRKLVCIGEPVRDKTLAFMRRGQALEEMWGGNVYSTYASSETATTFCECQEQAGGHIHPALGLVEITDEHGAVLPSGEVGEVVITPLMVEGMPLLRFRTGDISFLMDERCACGRGSPRLGPILGRKNQMIKYHGTTLYPQSIYSALDEMQEVTEYYVQVSSDAELSDVVQIHVAVKDNACSAEAVSERLQARLRVRPRVVVSDEEKIRHQVYAKSSRKPVRFIDKREKNNGML